MEHPWHERPAGMTADLVLALSFGVQALATDM